MLDILTTIYRARRALGVAAVQEAMQSKRLASLAARIRDLEGAHEDKSFI
jgi:hypothetical protein